MILTYRYRIKDRSAKKTLRRHAKACNVVWNYCNEVQHDIEARYRDGSPKRKWPSHFDLQRMTMQGGILERLRACGLSVAGPLP